jgi:hypothetical protein
MMNVIKFTFLFSLIIHLSHEKNDDGALLIGSWNIQSLGPTKMGRPDVVANIVKVLATFDIVQIQEIKDSTVTTVISKIHKDLNKFVEY